MSHLAAGPPGAVYLGDQRCRFCIWAPRAQRLELEITEPQPRRVELQTDQRGNWHAILDGIAPGTRYYYRFPDGRRLPDPASRFQPQGVHGPSQVVDLHFPWNDGDWHGLPLRHYILYELHVGTFTDEGTFDAAIAHLDYLKDLGITAVELMPVAQFPGGRNWGYDGAYLYAPQDTYGGPEGLFRLVDACHARGLAVVLDVVYNHFGPEGSYLREFGHYFTDRYHTPWGDAINFDDRHSDEVRRFFIENACYWVREFHIDGLRLDAVHAIFDESARPFLRALGDAVHQEADRLNRRVCVIAESNKNDVRHTQPAEIGGYGLDAQWNDDFHHSLRTLLTGDRDGYYADFGRLEQLARALRDGFVYSGHYSRYRGRSHGSWSRPLPAQRFVVFAQNHDQVGNRLLGERLSQQVPLEAYKLAAGCVLWSPYVPMLFMGEEYGETAPFLYFVSHSDPDLIEAVRRGRREEFKAFDWQGEAADPQAEETFRQCKLNHALRESGDHRMLLEFYRELIHLRRRLPALAELSKQRLEVQLDEKQRWIACRRWHAASEAIVIYSFNDEPISDEIRLPEGQWSKRFDSSDRRWHGGGGQAPVQLESAGEASLPLAPMSFVLYQRQSPD